MCLKKLLYGFGAYGIQEILTEQRSFLPPALSSLNIYTYEYMYKLLEEEKTMVCDVQDILCTSEGKKA